MGRKLTPYFPVNAQNPIEAEAVINPFLVTSADEMEVC
jgi:hypothetical protein